MSVSLVAEIKELDDLRRSGALSEEEFERAKAKLLDAESEPEHTYTHCQEPVSMEDQSLGRAANRFVTFQIVMAAIGIILFWIMLFAVVLPQFQSTRSMMGPF